MTVAFVLIRALNVYGDPQRWSPQSRGAVFTLLSFFNPEKYPPSLIYLLMTLGPALIVLALFERAGDPRSAAAAGAGLRARAAILLPAAYPAHSPTGARVFECAVRRPTGLLTMEPFVAAMTGNSVYPPEYGVSLPIVYAVWAAVVLLLYWPCCWFADWKRRRRDAWLSYF